MVTACNRSLFKSSYNIAIKGLLLILGANLFHLLHTADKGDQPQAQTITSTFDSNVSNSIVHAIRAAKKTIHLSTYSLHDQAISFELKKAMSKGIYVELHCPDVRTPPRNVPATIWYSKKKNPLWHHKILVIDGEKLLLGSANSTQTSLFVDENVLLTLSNPKLANYIIHGLHCPENTPYNDELYTFWFLPMHKEVALETLSESIQTAQTVQSALYFLTHPKLKKAFSVHDSSSLYLQSNLHNRKNAAQFIKTFGVLHTKLTLIDDKILYFGSANYSANAFKRNFEYILVCKKISNTNRRALHYFFKRLSYLKQN